MVEKTIIESLIADIHKSSLKGTIIECGCGAAITNALMLVPGASGTIYNAMQPYSKEIQEELFTGHAYERSVSLDFMLAVEQYAVDRLSDENNFFLAASVQMSDGNKDKVTHGWFMFYHKDMLHAKFMHFTLSKDTYLKSREDVLAEFGKIGVQILYSYLCNGLKIINTRGIGKLDMAYTNIIGLHLEMNTELVMNSMEADWQDYFVCVSGGKFVRLEDIMRRTTNFVIEKGSFNPLHHKHVEMIQVAVKETGAEPLFMISTSRYDKPHIDTEDLMRRVKTINDHGYDVLICKKALFYDNFETLLENVADDKHFVFVIGSDTINRIYDTDVRDHAADAIKLAIGVIRCRYQGRFGFLVLRRDGVEVKPEVGMYGSLVVVNESYVDDGTSSTAIRDGKIKNKLDEQDSTAV